MLSATKEELLFLADQQAYARSRYHEDDADLIRESLVIEQALRLSAQQREPVVRRLDWIERVGVAGTFDASTSIGHYIATITDDNRGMWFIVGQTTGEYMPPDIDAVQAAAQADYEQRIMAAIEIVAPSSTVEPTAHNSLDAGSSPAAPTISDGGSPGPSPLAVKPGSSDPASGRSQPSPDVSVDELEAFIGSLEPDSMAVARALLARYRIERLDRLASGRR